VGPTEDPQPLKSSRFTPLLDCLATPPCVAWAVVVKPLDPVSDVTLIDVVRATERANEVVGEDCGEESARGDSLLYV